MTDDRDDDHATIVATNGTITYTYKGKSVRAPFDDSVSILNQHTIFDVLSAMWDQIHGDTPAIRAQDGHAMTDEELLARLADSHLEGERQAAAAIERLISERDEARRQRPGEITITEDRYRAYQAAEAEVERLRGLLRRAGAALWETKVDHPVLQDIDDALPPGRLEDKP